MEKNRPVRRQSGRGFRMAIRQVGESAEGPAVSVDVPRVKAIFLEAVGQYEPHQWEQYVRDACAADDELRRRVEVLLHAHIESAGLLDALGPGSGTVPSLAAAQESLGSSIGPYKLSEVIGEGGMGVVYVAEQHQPVRRRVALKVIKPGMDSRQVVARFEAERQALALMEHPNIARVLDGGMTPSGRPYFVMELVRGLPITEYCDAERLSIRERLDLFVFVCRAVQHAHQKGIIHRDLKPSNVLVTVIDGAPVPKVIDFGVAKATGDRLIDETLLTGFRQMVGTPLYMSPEQADLSGVDVDTRSDIYALGVLLYELLTGTTPFDQETLRRAALDELRRIIREEEPPRPSTRLSALGESIRAVSAQREADPQRLGPSLRGELDSIVMKALEKDRNRRYETATGLADDVQRYLDGEPVQACPPSAGYRFRKFVRRNRGPALVGLALATLLVLGIVGTSFGLAWALRAERSAVLSATAETRQRREAQRQAQLAQQAMQKAIASEADTRAYSEFLVQDVLATARPKGERGGLGIAATVKDALDAATPQLGVRFRGRPLAEALARHDLGVTYRLLGEFDQSEAQLRLAHDTRVALLGAEHLDALESANSLAVLYHQRGKYTEALPLFVRTLKVRRRVLGERAPETLQSLSSLASLYNKQSKFDLAEPLLDEALHGCRQVLGDEATLTLEVMHELAALYRGRSRYPEAARLFQAVVAARRRVSGAEHPATLSAMNGLAGVHQDSGQFAEAQTLFAEVLEIRRRVLGPEHPETLTSFHNLALLLQSRHQYAEAESMLVKVLDLRTRTLGEDHPNTLQSMNSLGVLYKTLGKLDQAESLYRRSLEARRRKLGPDDPATLTSMNNLAGLLRAQGDLAQAEKVYSEALEARRRTLGPDNDATIRSLHNLAGLLQAKGELARAEPLYVEALKGFRRLLGEDHPHLLQTAFELAVLYQAEGKLTDAEPLLREFAGKVRQRKGNEVPLVQALSELGLNLLSQRRYGDAEAILRECLEISQRSAPDDWRTFQVKSLLGSSLAGQDRYADSEPLLLEGYQGLMRHEAAMPKEKSDYLARAIERIVQLYERWGKPEKAAAWRARQSDARLSEKK
jgi:serine/threonine protein kinase/tetratricopeptide (TPR) repeat protein